MSDLFFFLGAKDPEMDRIEEILIEHNMAYKYAMINNIRVHPGNAYNFYVKPCEINEYTIFIECFPYQLQGEESNYQRIDHHRVCDEGYYMKADQFWDASSIGQLYKMLNIQSDILYDDMILAAMDHCLPQALSGNLPGIKINDVLQRRILEISKTASMNVKQVEEKINLYKDIIALAPIKNINGFEIHDLTDTHLGYGYSADLLSAQTAASLIGVPILLKHGDAPLREKITLSGINTPENVIIVEEYLKKEDFKYIYSVPTRGYCGGYFWLISGL